VKLKTYGDPKSGQRGVRGTTISFPQENALATATELPHRLSHLTESLSIIFVGNKAPTEAQMKKIFQVTMMMMIKMMLTLKLTVMIVMRYTTIMLMSVLKK